MKSIFDLLSKIEKRPGMEFGEYLRTRFDWSLSCGAFSAILDHSKSPEKAWERFWKLVKEFRRTASPR